MLRKMRITTGTTDTVNPELPYNIFHHPIRSVDDLVRDERKLVMSYDFEIALSLHEGDIQRHVENQLMRIINKCIHYWMSKSIDY